MQRLTPLPSLFHHMSAVPPLSAGCWSLATTGAEKLLAHCVATMICVSLAAVLTISVSRIGFYSKLFVIPFLCSCAIALIWVMGSFQPRSMLDGTSHIGPVFSASMVPFLRAAQIEGTFSSKSRRYTMSELALHSNNCFGKGGNHIGWERKTKCRTPQMDCSMFKESRSFRDSRHHGQPLVGRTQSQTMACSELS